MNKNNVFVLSDQKGISDPLTELLRGGAQNLIQQAVELELKDFMAAYIDLRMPDGKAGVIRNGNLPERMIQTGIGPAKVQIPKVRRRTGEPVTFHSALVPPYIRKTRSLESTLP